MARIAEARAPASPTSESQIARYKRILDAAAELGARKRVDVVQMHEVAKDAGVAIATLYRYFPSKNALFAAVFWAEIKAFGESRRPGEGEDLVDQVTDFLVGLSRHLLVRPMLAAAMFQGTSAVYVTATMDEVEPTKSELGRILLRIIGAEEPNRQDLSVVRLLTHCWWGALISTLGGQTTLPRADADIRLAARLLLAPYSDDR
ncbi:TetR family transcriptional regulator [Streptosporangium sp. NBC_01755]|uniref:TetR family transcriptional regulator n=1 Tax=unclassified Streptosporangium TaxID=2632669 RepID=UPI002DDC0310|nr:MULTISPECIES: TetR family transcriptional regulator [unclassified Streptosporangium]WSA24251.1 TetR family transcriptional regulator [Streptosporangium sp. NBC_01810]WSC97674.1 TetR family transcriptional regulator [Streptosporangium sp. NBC_01755]